MIVSFSASLRTIKQDISIYRRILTAVRTFGATIAHDWVETGWLHQNDHSSSKQKQDWHAFSTEAEAAAISADLVIIEASGFSSFGVGYEASLAVQSKKPTLVLIKDQQKSVSYASGLERENVYVKFYDDTNLESSVTDFLQVNTAPNKDLRFNFVIDRRIYNHLRSKSLRMGKTKAEVLRELLLRDIDRSET
jgi:hypothetical protein